MVTLASIIKSSNDNLLSMSLQQEESNVGLPGGNGQLLTLGVGLLVTALAGTYVTSLAKDAIKDIDDDEKRDAK